MEVKYLLPTSPRAKLHSAIDLLSNNEVDSTTFLLLAAIAQSIIFSEECHIKFLDISFEAALEIYGSAEKPR